MIKDSHRRSPGFFERQYICRNTKDYWGNFNITVKYSRHISRQLLSNALRNVVLQNQNFVLNFYRLGGSSPQEDHKANGHNYEVRPVEKITFESVVSIEELDGPFDDSHFTMMNQFRCDMNEEETPLWRVILWEYSGGSNDQYLSFYCDHALFDGTSGVQFHRDLIVELARLSKEEDSLEFIETLFDYELDSKSLPDPIDDALEHKIDLYDRPLVHKIYLWLKSSTTALLGSVYSVSRTVTTLFRRLLGLTDTYQAIDSGDREQLFKYKPGTAGLVHRYKIINFPPTETSQILKFCKSEGITLTPFIFSVATRCFERTIFKDISLLVNGKEYPTKNYSTISKISINGRRHYSVQENQKKNLKYGVCVATTSIPLPSLADYDDQKLLGLVRKLSAQVSSLAKLRDSFWKFGDYLKTANFWDSFKNQIGNYTRDTLYTSNLGKVDIKNVDDWNVKNIWFTQSNGLVYHFVFSVVSSPAGGLNIGFGYLPEFDDVHGSVDRFVSSFKNDMIKYSL